MAHEELPPLNITPGAIRFNTDSMKLEYFRIGMEGGSTSSYAGIGNLAAGEWVQLTTDSPDIQTGGTRGVIAGGETPSVVNVIDYFNLDSTGNAIDFGDLSVARRLLGSLSSRTLALWLGGRTSAPANSDVIDEVTITSTGNAVDFGNLLSAGNQHTGLANATRGIAFGAGSNVIEYVTISSRANSVDFGDLGTSTNNAGGCASSTRGIMYSGISGPGAGIDVIQHITISTLGNASDFGDPTVGRACAGGSNSVRGVFGGGYIASPATTRYDTIDYITIATLGNATDFGDTTQSRGYVSGTSSPTRVVIIGGGNGSTKYNIIDYVQIMSTGNAVDFGDISTATEQAGACSNGHGGL